VLTSLLSFTVYLRLSDARSDTRVSLTLINVHLWQCRPAWQDVLHHRFEVRLVRGVCQQLLAVIHVRAGGGALGRRVEGEQRDVVYGWWGLYHGGDCVWELCRQLYNISHDWIIMTNTVFPLPRRCIMPLIRRAQRDFLLTSPTTDPRCTNISSSTLTTAPHKTRYGEQTGELGGWPLQNDYRNCDTHC